MNLRRIHVQLITAVASVILPIGSALACPYLVDGSNLFENNLGGFQGIVDDFRVGEDGTLTVSLAEVPNPYSIADSGFGLWTSTSFIGQLNGAGDISIPVTANTIYYIGFGPDDRNPLGLDGTIGVNLDYQPAGGTSVPLPDSLLLVLSGLGLVSVGGVRKAMRRVPKES